MKLRLAIAMAMGAALGMAQQKSAARPAAGPGLTLSSPGFADGAEVPAKFTMNASDGNGVSPKLEWTNVPAGTVSFALILHDPDVAIRKNTDDVLHWMIFNIPGTARELAEGEPATATLADGSIQAKNLRGRVGYMGPGAPAAGPDHHYTFELFALDIKLELGPDASRADVLKAMEGHILGKGVVVGRFHR